MDQWTLLQRWRNQSAIVAAVLLAALFGSCHPHDHEGGQIKAVGGWHTQVGKGSLEKASLAKRLTYLADGVKTIGFQLLSFEAGC